METKHFGQFNSNIQPSRDYTVAVNKIESQSLKDKILDGLLMVCGFTAGKRVAHNMTHPSGHDIRGYCGNAGAIVDILKNDDGSFTVAVVEAPLLPSQQPSRPLMEIQCSQEELPTASAAASHHAAGYNHAFGEIRSLQNGDIKRMNSFVAAAVKTHREKVTAARKAEKMAAKAAKKATKIQPDGTTVTDIDASVVPNPA